MCEAEDHILPGWWSCDLSPSRIETWQEDGKWFAKLVYQGEHDGIKFRLLIPKVFLGRFWLQDLYIEQTLNHNQYGYADFDFGVLETYHDDHGNTAYFEIGRETHRMTIDQIEKKLGYKIEIVSSEDGVEL